MTHSKNNPKALSRLELKKIAAFLEAASDLGFTLVFSLEEAFAPKTIFINFCEQLISINRRGGEEAIGEVIMELRNQGYGIVFTDIPKNNSYGIFDDET